MKPTLNWIHVWDSDAISLDQIKSEWDLNKIWYFGNQTLNVAQRILIGLASYYGDQEALYDCPPQKLLKEVIYLQFQQSAAQEQEFLC